MLAGRRRWLFLALLALAVPLPALALSSGADEAGPAPVALSVSTSLHSCGVADTQVICKLGVSFNAIPGATSYTASVTRADGSVVDYGELGAGGGELWVPYAGSGHYSVRISAYGTPPEAETGDPDETGSELITSEATEATGVGREDAGNAREVDGPGARDGAKAAPAPATATASHDAGPGAPAGGKASCETPPAPTPEPEREPLPEPPPNDLDPANPDEDADGIDDAKERAAFELALSERAAAALSQHAELPDAIECAEATAR